MPKAYNIDQILGQSPNKAQYALCGALEKAGGLHTPGALNAAEATFLAAFNCWGGIESEGLNGWLLNTPDPQVFTHAVEAFRTIGAASRADALWRVADLFPDSALPDDQDAFADVVTSDDHDGLYEEIEEQMRDDEVEAMLHRYVCDHIQEFK